MKLQTTLNIIRAASPCADGWTKLLKSLPVGYDHNAPIDFLHILGSNGLDEALWALRCVIPEQEARRDREARLFACDCAEGVLHIFEAKYPRDKQYRACIDVARRFANGNATKEELDAAWAAARDSAWDSSGAAAAAAWDAAGDSAWYAAENAAGDAAGAAAGAAAWDSGDARVVARRAARAKQEAQFKVRFCTQEASK